jgi:inorganic pyrophosphatase
MKLPPPFTKDKRAVHAVIETPRGSRCKYNYDPATGLFKLKKILPSGTIFPIDFGFIPGTEGADGDPLDVLVIMEKYAYPGCLVECRMIGMIKALQEKEGKKPKRNDRFLAVPLVSRDYEGLQHISDIPGERMDDLLRFFEYYNRMEEKVFRVLEMQGPEEAMQYIRKNKK